MLVVGQDEHLRCQSKIEMDYMILPKPIVQQLLSKVLRISYRH